MLVLLEWGLLLSGVLLLTVTEEFNPLIPFGGLLLLAAFTLRGLRTGHFIVRTGLEVPWGIFLCSALIATTIAYNPGTALLQFYRILAACVMYYAVVCCREEQLGWLACGFVLAAAGLAVYWPIQHDFAAVPGKLPLITQAGAWINALIPAIPGPQIHNNVAAGTLALAIPFGIACMWTSLQQGHRARLLLSAGSTLIICLGLFLTSSRGAWMAVAGTALLAGLAWLQQRIAMNPRTRLASWLAVLLLAVASAGFILVNATPELLLGGVPGKDGAVEIRSYLWSQGISMVRDYSFTGSGLMTYWMVNAVYAMLVDVPYIAHSHNIFLQVWIEQGIVGVLAVLLAAGVVLGWSWKALARGHASAWGWAGLAALTITVLHGLVDVVFYVERTLPLLGLPLGYAYFLKQAGEDPAASQGIKPAARGRLALAGVCAAVLIAGAGLIHRQLISQWYSNYGAILQTRYELASFDPADPVEKGLDLVRRTDSLAAAEAAFQKALDWQSTNPTALQRLTHLYLSRGQYAEALATIRTAWESGRRDEITRFLLADALVAHGEVDEAASLLVGSDWAVYRLMNQAWYRYWLGRDFRRAADAWRTILILEPENEPARRSLEEAQERLK